MHNTLTRTHTYTHTRTHTNAHVHTRARAHTYARPGRFLYQDSPIYERVEDHVLMERAKQATDFGARNQRRLTLRRQTRHASGPCSESLHNLLCRAATDKIDEVWHFQE